MDGAVRLGSDEGVVRVANAPNPLGFMSVALPRFPVKRFRFSGYSGTIQQGPAQRQNRRIVQSSLDLRDLLP